jgi:DnaJ-domain-containing protein 1
MPEPVRIARIAEAYSTSANLCFRPRNSTDNPLRDTVEISSEAQEKSREFLSKLKEKSSSEKPSSKPSAQNNLDILHLAANATKEQIRQAYLAAIKQYHPDNFAGLGTEFRELAEEKSKQINLAYQKLTDM